MCRIVGMIYGPDGPSVEEKTPEQMAKMLLPSATPGGPHAWGWMSYNEESSDIDITKFVGRADTKSAKNKMKVDPDCQWWIGHTRWATHGDYTEPDNNHPIHHDQVVGVHNGVMRNWESLMNKIGRFNLGTDEEPKFSEVDSEVIFASVNKYGHKKGLEKLEGALVAVYVNINYPDTIRIARTDGREIHLAWTPTGAMIFASDPSFIIDTGISLVDPPSPVRNNRLLQVRKGKIVRRFDLDIKATPIADSSMSSSGLRNMIGRHKGQRSDGIRGMTDRMTPSRPELPPAPRNDHGGRITYGPAVHVAQPRLGRKADALRNELLQRGGKLHPKPVIRMPEQSFRKQEDSAVAPNGLIWWKGALVDIETYVENKLREEKREKEASQ